MLEALKAQISSAAYFSAGISVWLQTHGVRIAVTVLLFFMGYKLFKGFIERSLKWKKSNSSGRVETLHAVSVLVLKVVFVISILLVILPEFGFTVGPLIASLGIFGLAFSFGAQTLVKDIVSGLLLLAEDVCRVGEDVQVGAQAGKVVSLKLRTLVIRGENGSLIFIPYGSIQTLENRSRKIG